MELHDKNMEPNSDNDMCTQDDAILGIDLGTSNCCIATWANGRAEVILDEQGHRTTPNCVLYTESLVIVGGEAKHRAPLYPSNTITNALQLAGRRRVDVLDIVTNLPHDVIEMHDRLKIMVTQQNGQPLGLFPEEVLATILCHLKHQAEARLGLPVHQAVVSHPHNFNLLQLQSLKMAAQLADLDIKLFSSTGLAAVAYAHSTTDNPPMKILVFDMGSSKVEVSVVRVLDGTNCVVLSGSASYECSGDHATNILVGHVKREVQRHYRLTTPTDGRTQLLLRAACERAKIALSGSTVAHVALDQVFNGHFDSLKITRDVFDELCEDQFMAALEVVNGALSNASVQDSQIDSVILVGGASRSPQLQKLLQEKFQKQLKKIVNADEGVAIGAAIVAANMRTSNVAGLTEVAPHSIGIQTTEDIIFNVIPKGHLIPARNETMFEREHDDILRPLVVKVYEGENNRTRGNAFIKEVVVSNSSAVSVLLALSLEVNSQLGLSFTDSNTSTVLIEDGDICRKLYSSEEMEFMKMRNQQVQQQLQRRRKAMEARNELESYTFSVKSAVEAGELINEAADAVLMKCKSVLDKLAPDVIASEEGVKILYLELKHLYEHQKERNALRKVITNFV